MIGSSRCLLLFCLVGVIDFVLVFRQSIENRSICKTSDLRIFNGRTTGDSFGNVTLHSTKGFNTLDYVIVSHELINLFENVIAKELTFFSDDSLRIYFACYGTDFVTTASAFYFFILALNFSTLPSPVANSL